MPSKQRRIVLDACCLLAVLLGEERDNRCQRVEAVLSRHGNELEVMVPAIAQLEVLGKAQKGKDGSTGHTAEQREVAFKAAKKWIEDQSFLTANLDIPVMDRALRLMVPYGLKGADASIVAVALLHEAEVLYSFDKEVLNIGDSIDGLKVMEPSESERLF
nr:PIN domain-containing protein [Pseudoclavibacter sp. Marseille-Q3772]